MNDREFSHIEIFQHSGRGIPLFMTDHKNCLKSDYFLEVRLTGSRRGVKVEKGKHEACPESKDTSRVGR
jgi:hypothetical protein